VDAFYAMETKEYIVIRHAIPHDLPQVANIYNSYVLAGCTTMDTELKDADYYQSVLDGFSDREALMVMVDKELVLGWGIIKRYSDRLGYQLACETAVYLCEKHISKGYGTQIKKHLIELCRHFGYHHLVARIFAENTRSIEYNKKLGYEIVGVQREIGFVRDQRKDIVIMQLILN